MPYRKKKPMYRKRRKPFKRYRKKRGLSSNLQKLVNPLPSSYFTTLRYVSDRVGTGTLGALTTQIFSANGLYDPDITSTGHSARGLDNFCPTMFAHYTAYKTRIKVVTHNSTSGYPIIWGISPQAGTTPLDINDYLEDRRTKWVVLSPTGDDSEKTLSYTLGVGAFLGRKTTDDDICRGSSTTNPSEQCYFHVFYSTLEVDSQNYSWRSVYTLDYSTKFTEPATLAQS